LMPIRKLGIHCENPQEAALRSRRADSQLAYRMRGDEPENAYRPPTVALQ